MAGLISLLLGAIAGIPAVVMGLAARRRAAGNQDRVRRTATAGVALGSVSLVLTAIAAVLYFGGPGTSPAYDTETRAAVQEDCRSLRAFMQRLMAGDTSVINQADIDQIMWNFSTGYVGGDPAAMDAWRAMSPVHGRLTGLVLAERGGYVNGFDVEGWAADVSAGYNRAAVACERVGVQPMPRAS